MMVAVSQSTLRRTSLAVAALTLFASMAANAQVAEGTGATADSSSVALGNSSTAANSSVAAGANSTATGVFSTAVGSSSQATAQDSSSVGYQAKATAVGATAVGYNSTATGVNGFAAGSGAGASGSNAVAVGTNAVGAGDYALSFGYGANVAAGSTNGIALGQSSGVFAVGGISMGLSAMVYGLYGIADGASARATGAYSVALGYQANASQDYSVALGNGSTTYAVTGTSGMTIRGTSYTFAGTTPTGTVSVGTVGGERTITNVAAGQVSADSTDAVNGSQLYAATQAIEALTSGTSLVAQPSGTSGTITVGASTGGTTVDLTGTSGARTLTGVAAGSVSATSTDAVNGSQLNATNQTVSSLITQVSTNTTNIASNTSSINAINSGLSNGTVGLVQQTFGSPGNGSITVGASTGGTSVDFTGTSGARTLTGVAAGTGSTDAVNVGQLDAALANVTSATSNAVSYDSSAKTSVTLGGVGATTPVIFTNVAPGALTATSTNAVNGSQLFATNQAVSSLGTRVTALEAAEGTSSGVSAAYVQQQVAAAVSSANTYTDQQSAAAVTSANGYTDQAIAKIPTTGSGSGDATTVLQSANTYTDQETAQTLSQSKTYTDQQAAQTLSQSKSYTDQQVGALSNSVDQRFDAVNRGMNDLSNRIDGVGAMSAAAASAMYNPDSAHDTQAAIGVANFRGQFGYSVKVFHRFGPNAVVNLNVGGATGAAGVAVGGGINIGF